MKDTADGDLCANEPIRVPGAIQPQGAVLVVAPDGLAVLQASENAAPLLGAGPGLGPAMRRAAGPALGQIPGLGKPLASAVAGWLASEDAVLRRAITLPAGDFHLTGHRGHQGAVLEFEPADPVWTETLDTLQPRMQHFLDRLESATDVRRLSQIAAAEFRDLTGFDRVLVYRFDANWNGSVIAEDRAGVLPPYLDLHFPASDVPAQARDLYRLNRLRLIPDAAYVAVPIEPALSPVDTMPLDLSAVALRSVSPMHLEYMRNMGTAASMSVSLLIDGQLWGLVACHHPVPRRVSPPVRAACDLLGQFLAQQIGARQRMALAERRSSLKRMQAGLLADLVAAPTIPDGLARNERRWCALAGGAGAAVVVAGAVRTAGRTPSPEKILALAEWLQANHPETVFASNRLSASWPEARSLADTASGLLAISISQLHASYIMWFRPEIVRTVQWGGTPDKPADGAGERVHPRRSFALWQAQERLHAAPWDLVETEAASDLRTAIINVVLRRAEERAVLIDELQRANKELESFSYSVSHDLRAPLRRIGGLAEQLSGRATSAEGEPQHTIDSIVEAAVSAGRLVDDLLTFSQINRRAMTRAPIDMRQLFSEARRVLQPEEKGRAVVWQIAALPAAWGDAGLLRQVLVNLLSNALKYTRRRDRAVIRIEGEDRLDEAVYRVQDNGTGFDMSYVGKLFGVFQRLHRSEDFEGTGIGLALAKRIVDRHRGWIEAVGMPDQGATFSFGLPKRPPGDAHG